ncbi:protein kinase [Frankia sp. Cj3]|uniref:protein kinase domain-containing protein n=2 Tax=unclassified Frankia TaxID=2632575 RepID=UPI001EF52C73|nr:protein kinase [Frankia sp. Cj3]
MDGITWAVTVPPGYLVGQWRVVDGIATGSWGSVYRGELAEPAGEVGGDDDSRPGAGCGLPGRARPPAQTALKFLPTGTVTARQLAHMAAMAARELDLYRRLSHPRLVRLFEALTVDDPEHGELDGATVLVMELAEESLDALLRRSDGPAPDAARMIVEICEGTAFLHSQGWLHGDLKPANVLRMADGSTRLTDFGLATELEGTHGYLPPMGSSDYVPPERGEQLLTDRGSAVRTTLDIWALGVTAHLALTGRHPFLGATARSRVAAIAEYAAGRQALSLDPGLSPGWRSFIADCLAPDHQTRSRHNAADLLARAQSLAGTRTSGRSRQAIRRHRFRGRGQAVAVATAAATIAIPLVLTLLPDEAGRSSTEAGTVSVAGLSTVGPLTKASSAEPSPVDAASQWLNTDAGIPEQFLSLIIAAGTMCDEPSVSPALVAAMLEAESGFDPNLNDPARDEYGIARWTPRVLQYYLPPGRRGTLPRPPFSPEDSIPAVGRYLCVLARQLETVPGQPELLLAAAYRTSAEVVRVEGGIPDRTAGYVERVRTNLLRYAPVGTPSRPAPSSTG